MGAAAGRGPRPERASGPGASSPGNQWIHLGQPGPDRAPPGHGRHRASVPVTVRLSPCSSGGDAVLRAVVVPPGDGTLQSAGHPAGGVLAAAARPEQEVPQLRRRWGAPPPGAGGRGVGVLPPGSGAPTPGAQQASFRRQETGALGTGVRPALPSRGPCVLYLPAPESLFPLLQLLKHRRGS